LLGGLYIAISALVINIVVAVVLTLVLQAIKAPSGSDESEPDDYYSDAAAPREPVRVEERATA
jgi:solute:Na+ symporter, SSS family